MEDPNKHLMSSVSEGYIKLKLPGNVKEKGNLKLFSNYST